MKPTALKALTVAALSAASILLSSQAALAGEGGPGGCAADEQFDPAVPTCVPLDPAQTQEQSPQERIGRVLDLPDGQQCTVVAVDPDVLDCQPQPQPPVLAQPGPAVGQDAQGASAQPEPAAPAAPAETAVALGSPQASPEPMGHATPAQPSVQPAWVSLDKIVRILHGWLGWLIGESI